MKNAWTGGQYSLFRIALAVYLFVHFAQLLPWGTELFSSAGALVPASTSPLAHLFPNVLLFWDGPVVVRWLLIAGVASTIPLALGMWDRLAAVVLWYLWACLFGRNPLIANPSLPFIGWMLLAHALVPAAPFGSLKAKGRADPGGDWAMPEPLFLAAWVVMGLGYLYSGVTKLVSPSWVDGSAFSYVLANPLARPGPVREFLLSIPPGFLRLATWSALSLELLFAPLALFRRLRPWVWLAMVSMHAGLLLLVDFADLTFGMLLLHALTFDPGWIRPDTNAATTTVFYDGYCGLCHRVVRFVIAENRSRGRFRFAPLQGAMFRRQIPDTVRATLPDSLVVLDADGSPLTRSEAVLHLLTVTGGMWRVIAAIASLVPSRVRDAVYDGVARIRYRVFRRQPDLCPVIPSSLRGQFELE